MVITFAISHNVPYGNNHAHSFHKQTIFILSQDLENSHPSFESRINQYSSSPDVGPFIQKNSFVSLSEQISSSPIPGTSILLFTYCSLAKVHLVI